jgi:hypothetical protein
MTGSRAEAQLRLGVTKLRAELDRAETTAELAREAQRQAEAQAEAMAKRVEELERMTRWLVGS